MKVTMMDGYKDYMTVREVEAAREIIAQEKEDDMSAKDAAEMLVREVLKNKNDFLCEVLKASAKATNNCRTWNAFSDHSGHADIWVDATAETAEGFVKCGAYLTDIWQTGAEDYSMHTFVQYFTER